MKKRIILLIPLIFSLISCSSKVKKEKDEKEILADSISALITTESEVIDVFSHAPREVNNPSFIEVLNTIKTKTVPLLEATNFDSFIEEEDYDAVNVAALKLIKVFPDFNKEGYPYRAIANYRIALSDQFYTVVVTVLQGDNEMVTTLINYDLDGNIIAHELLAYDEIAEGQSKTESTIEKDRITSKDTYWVSEDDGEVEEIETIRIEPNGTFKQLTIEDILIDIVIKDLNLNRSNLIPRLQHAKMLPYKANEAIVVLAEIADGSEADGFIELNSHIAIVNSETKSIIHKYFESFTTNGWVSDAIQLREITIDTAPYIVADGTRAFGVGVYYYGMSHANPYENKKLSLFIKSGETLNKVLHNFDIMEYGGEWDTNCEGDFLKEERTLIMADQKTNDYFNILVKNKITKTKNEEDEKGDCDAKETISYETLILKFDGKEYKNL